MNVVAPPLRMCFVAGTPITAVGAYFAFSMAREGVPLRSLGHSELRAWGAVLLTSLLLSWLTATLLNSKPRSSTLMFLTFASLSVASFVISPLVVDQLIVLFRTSDVSMWGDHLSVLLLAPATCTVVAALALYRRRAVGLSTAILLTFASVLFLIFRKV